MIRHLTRAIAQLGDRRIGIVLFGSLAATVGLYVLAWVVAFWLIGDLQLIEADWQWWQDLANWLIGFLVRAGVILLSLLLFTATVSVISSFFAESVADAVEDRHYPGLAPPTGTSMWRSVTVALKFTGITIVLNLAALPLYLLLLLVPGGPLVLFYALNGYLFGREYFEIVGLRRLDEGAARALRRANRWPLFLAGVMLTVLSTIPVANLLVPVLGTAFMTHVFHALPRRA